MGRGEELLGALWFYLRAEDRRAVVHRRRPREPSLPCWSQSVSSSVLFRSRSLSDHLRHGHVPRQHPELPLSSHVGAGTSLFPHCPASCVEEGRWHPSGAGFVPSLVLNVFHVFCGEIYSRSGVAACPCTALVSSVRRRKTVPGPRSDAACWRLRLRRRGSLRLVSQ